MRMYGAKYAEMEKKYSELFEKTLVRFNAYEAEMDEMQAKISDDPHKGPPLCKEDIGRFLNILDTLSKRGAMQILYFLVMNGTIRFNELQKMLKSTKLEKFEHLGNVRISSRTLSQRLKELEKHGIVTKTRYAETPPRVEYSLTEEGQELKLPLVILLFWVRRGRQKKLVYKSPAA